jgi:hypothetical protein
MPRTLIEMMRIPGDDAHSGAFAPSVIPELFGNIARVAAEACSFRARRL